MRTTMSTAVLTRTLTLHPITSGGLGTNVLETPFVASSASATPTGLLVSRPYDGGDGTIATITAVPGDSVGPLASGIPCLVIEDNDVAHEASTAENTLRENMHPADQFEAFKRMVDKGKSVIDVAAHFGIGENELFLVEHQAEAGPR